MSLIFVALKAGKKMTVSIQQRIFRLQIRFIACLSPFSGSMRRNRTETDGRRSDDAYRGQSRTEAAVSWSPLKHPDILEEV